MSEQQTFERIVAESVSSVGPLVPSDEAIERTLSRTGTKRQRPRWLALIKEPPMHSDSRTTVGSPTVRVAAIMAATLMLVLAMTLVGAGAQRLLAAGDIVVSPDGDGDYATITEAVDAAADGDTILVKPGTYDEQVLITEDVAIRGDGAREEIVIEVSEETPEWALLTTEDLPYSLRLEDSGATIEGLTLRGDSSRVEVVGGAPTFRNNHFDDIGRVFGLDPGSTSVPPGVDVQEGADGVFEDNRFSRATLVIRGGSSPHVAGNTFDPGAVFTDGEGTKPLIENNEIAAQGTFHAVTVFGAARPAIRNNTISSEGYGISVRYSGFPSTSVGPWPTIVGNTVEGTQRGIDLVDGTGGTVEANQLTDNTVAIWVQGGPRGELETSISQNTVRGGEYGISIGGDGAPTVSGNDVAGAAKAGITVGSSSPTITDNTVCDNGVDVQVGPDADPAIDDTNEICGDIVSP